VARALGRQAAGQHVETLLSLFAIAPVNRLVLEEALRSRFHDFEDAVLHEAALHAGVKYIVTRNLTDFQQASIPVFSPRELISMLQALE